MPSLATLRRFWNGKLFRQLVVRSLLPMSVVLSLLAVQAYDPLFRVRLRDMSFDQLHKIHPGRYADDIPVRVVAIDDQSLATVGQWPWPRTVLAQVIDQLQAMGARVVVLDVILAESDRTSPEEVKKFWPESPKLDAILNTYPSHDMILAASLVRSRVVAGVVALNTYPPAVPPTRKVEI